MPTTEKWSLVSVTNNKTILENCLLSSPDVSTATEVILQKNCQSAAQAYNAALDLATTDLLVFAHQDVYLPEGWLAQFQNSLLWLAKNDPDWAVAGLWGVKPDENWAGNVYCAGLRRVLGRAGEYPVQVRSLDELLLIVRKSSGVRFDERLPGFHLYGTDICLEAARRGKKCYVLSAFCIHNTNGYNWLPWAFWKNYFFMRKKWRAELPVTTACAKITFSCWPALWWNIDRGLNLLLKRHKTGKRVFDPVALYNELAVSHPELAKKHAN